MSVKHRVEYLMPGSFYAEESYADLESRSIDEAVAKAPSRAFCFVLYDVPEIDFEYDETRFSVSAKRQNVSARHYIGGEVFTVDDLKAMNGDGRLDILISNAEGNGWPQIIRTRAGNWQPLEDGDILVGNPA